MAERFRQVIVGAGLECTYSCVLASICGQDDNGSLAAGSSELREQVEAIAIQHDNGWAQRNKQVHGRPLIMRCCTAHPRPLQGVRDQLHELAITICNENLGATFGGDASLFGPTNLSHGVTDAHERAARREGCLRVRGLS